MPVGCPEPGARCNDRVSSPPAPLPDDQALAPIRALGDGIRKSHPEIRASSAGLRVSGKERVAHPDSGPAIPPAATPHLQPERNMRTCITSIVAVSLAGSAFSQTAPVEHDWTDLQGRTVKAEFVDLEAAALTMRAKGRLYTVQLSKLAPQSAKLALELDAATEPPDLNSTVLATSRNCLGRRVGNGQCTSLATHALATAGAAGISRDFPAAGDYVWGTLVTVVSKEPAGVKGIPTLAVVRGGDVIQMRNVLLNGGTPTGGTYRMMANHHTAVVESADPVRGTVTLLHQNWNGGPVQRDVFNLGDLKRGWLRVYRPVAKR